MGKSRELKRQQFLAVKAEPPGGAHRQAGDLRGVVGEAHGLLVSDVPHHPAHLERNSGRGDGREQRSAVRASPAVPKYVPRDYAQL
jgi:hypothetical protein